MPTASNARTLCDREISGASFSVAVEYKGLIIIVPTFQTHFLSLFLLPRFFSGPSSLHDAGKFQSIFSSLLTWCPTPSSQQRKTLVIHIVPRAWFPSSLVFTFNSTHLFPYPHSLDNLTSTRSAKSCLQGLPFWSPSSKLRCCSAALRLGPGFWNAMDGQFLPVGLDKRNLRC